MKHAGRWLKEQYEDDVRWCFRTPNDVLYAIAVQDGPTEVYLLDPDDPGQVLGSFKSLEAAKDTAEKALYADYLHLRKLFEP